jgi:hypothetical protein
MKSALSFFLTILTLAACTPKPSSTIFLSFTESSSEGGYPVRMLVNDQFLRIEDGESPDGFILFNRATQTIYSVSHTAKTTLVLHAMPVTLAKPARFENEAKADKETLPSVDGKTVVHYRLFTNGERCFDVYAAAGLLPEAVTALREYHETLAGEQAAMQANMPVSMQSVCDLADQIFLPARYLAQGFPVRQVNLSGVTRQLVSYKRDVPVQPGIFEVPKEYKEISPATLRKP